MAHKGARNDLAADYVRSILDYDPEAGVFRWKKRLSWRAPAGAIAGCPRKSGHITIGINGKEYYAHRLAHLIMTGEWPPYEMDHKNSAAPGDNRWEHIRPATSSENLCNRVAKIGQSGYRGVSQHPTGRWVAKITKNRKQYYLGIFDTPQEAHEAYCDAAFKMHGQFARM